MQSLAAANDSPLKGWDEARAARTANGRRPSAATGVWSPRASASAARSISGRGTPACGGGGRGDGTAMQRLGTTIVVAGRLENWCCSAAGALEQHRREVWGGLSR